MENTPLTVKQLKEQLDWLLKNGQIQEDDYLFYHLPNEDEGSLDSLHPIAHIGGPHIKGFQCHKDKLDELIKTKGVNVSFVSPNLHEL